MVQEETVVNLTVVKGSLTGFDPKRTVLLSILLVYSII